MSQPVVPPRDERFDLRDYSTDKTPGIGREEGEREFAKLQVRLNELQDLLLADRRFAILVILEAVDAGGKDGTIKAVFEEVGPLGCNVHSFGVPSEEEQAHDYLWRCHSRLPALGQLTIFNRSYYEDVLVVRVRGYEQEERWRKRYDQINHFERMLTEEGTVILKFFLHISKEEQRVRLQERVDDPAKRWKFHKRDLEDRALWDDYQRAFEDMVERCNTEQAPWHVIPGDKNWYRNLLVARTIVARLEKLDLRYPEAEEEIEGIRIV
jgi:PPK2 family polyphosphate:nucleotide phosphotransferase